MSASKYIAVNGRMVPNPQYQEKLSDEQQAKLLADVANPSRALTCVYGMNDANEAVNAMGLPTPAKTLQTFEKVQSNTYVGGFGAKINVDGGQLLENISNTFTKYKIPIGLASKLVDLQGYALHFKIDDSGSMAARSNNGKTRWENVEARLHLLFDLLQYVPTGPIRLSFLDRYSTITFERRDETPEQFAKNAHRQITQAFRTQPNGGTPLYSNIKDMLKTKVKTSHYLLTDGVPNQYGSGREDMENEIRDIKNLLIGRRNPRDNPFTFLCCSDIPTDTLWMHEIEEIACYPGRPGYVAALQNFLAERVEVLNDQGPEFPYSESVWTLCNLCASLNPDDLDALDQHAPFSKPTLDNLMGRTLTESEYHSYFQQHPNAMWLFKEDYEALLTAPIARLVPSIALFDKTLSNRLSKAINSGNDNTEPLEIGYTEEVVLNTFKRQRPEDIRNARRDFWRNHCLNMERAQPLQARQDIWGDYVAWRDIQPAWTGYIQPVSIPPSSNESPIKNDDIILFAPSSNDQPVVNTQEVYKFSYPNYYSQSNYSRYSTIRQQNQYRDNACCSIF